VLRNNHTEPINFLGVGERLINNCWKNDYFTEK
jgi:hypothetical protein